MTIDSTVKRIDPPGWFEMFSGGGIAAIFVFSIGVFMLVIPIVGWILGPALMISAGVIAVLHIAEMFNKKPAYSGHCPYCGAAAAAGNPGAVGQCRACRNIFVHRDGELLQMEK